MAVARQWLREKLGGMEGEREMQHLAGGHRRVLESCGQCGL